MPARFRGTARRIRPAGVHRGTATDGDHAACGTEPEWSQKPGGTSARLDTRFMRQARGSGNGSRKSSGGCRRSGCCASYDIAGWSEWVGCSPWRQQPQLRVVRMRMLCRSVSKSRAAARTTGFPAKSKQILDPMDHRISHEESRTVFNRDSLAPC